MAKRTNKSTKRNAPIMKPVGYFETGDDGDISINVSARHFVQIDIDGHQYPVELNRWEAVKLGEALIKAAKTLDGGR